MSQLDEDDEDASALMNRSNTIAGGGLPTDLDQLDSVLEQLSIEIQSCGFPDCGNLRSTKRKDVRFRVKCLQAMLRQRKKDIDFRSGLQDRFSKSEHDAEALIDKIARKDAKIKQLENNKFSLQNQIKEKDEEVR